MKTDAWSYEQEWRLVRETVRPRMRLWATAGHQIYNAIHEDTPCTEANHIEWDQRNKPILAALEAQYETQRTLPIRPAKIFLGLRFKSNETDETTAKMAREIVAAAMKYGADVVPMRADQSSFILRASQRANLLFVPE